MKTLFKRLAASRDLVIELQREMTARPALSPEAGGQGEWDKAEWLASWLSKLPGLRIEWQNAPDERAKNGTRPNFRVRLAGKQTRTLWVLGHLDVVAPGDESLWQQPSPWELRVEGDQIYGRGVEDNQQAITSALVLLHALSQGEQPELSFGLICVADEESGNKWGLDFLVREVPDWFKPEDLYLAPDHGAPNGLEIEIAEKSMLWVRCAVKGRQAHASRPNTGVNSLEAAAALILASRELYTRFPKTDPLFDPPASTFAATKFEANVPNVNIIPGADTFYIDCRVLPDYPLDEVRAALRQLADKVEKDTGANITLSDVQSSQAPPPLDAHSDIVRRLSTAIRAEYQAEPKLVGIGGGTVAAILRRANIPAAVWSTLNGKAHAYNESSSITNTLTDARIIGRMLEG